MSGLIKNNFYTSLATLKLYTVFMAILGIAALLINRVVPSFPAHFSSNFSMLCIVGHSSATLFGMQKEFASKWNQYKLTAPVTRASIIKSYYITHFLWTLIGVLFVSVWIGFCFLQNVSAYNNKVDFLTAFTVSCSVSFLTGAIFYPLFHLGKPEQYESIVITSLVSAFLIMMGAVRLLNQLFSSMTSDTIEILAFVLLMLFSLCLFAASCPLAVWIFNRKDY